MNLTVARSKRRLGPVQAFVPMVRSAKFFFALLAHLVQFLEKDWS